jgi:hypothetical protein
LTDSESNETLKSRGIGRFDLVAAIVIFALAIALLVEGDRAAAAAVREYGRNVDSGVYEGALAVLVLIPMSVGFLVASILRRKSPGLAVGVRTLSIAWPLVLLWLVLQASQQGWLH